MNFTFIFTALYIYLFSFINSYTSVPTAWNYSKRGSVKLINYNAYNQTSAASQIIRLFLINYLEDPFSSIPKLVFGFKTLQIYDDIGTQNINIKTFEQETTNFKVNVTIKNSFIMVLDLCFLATDQLFPYPFNTFMQIPINYLSPMNPNMSLPVDATHTQLINYTQIAGNNSMKYFVTPYTDNKIITFITGYNYILDPGNTSVTLRVESQIMSSSMFKLKLTKQKRIILYQFILNFMVIDFGSISRTTFHSPFYQEFYCYSMTAGCYMHLPYRLLRSLMIGLTSFSSFTEKASMDYSWQFYFNYNSTSNAGLMIQKINPFNQTLFSYGLTYSYTSVFYINTTDCPETNVFYNSTSERCQDKCADYYFSNFTDKKCYKCHYSCRQCDKVPANKRNSCTLCDNSLKRILQNNYCICQMGTFDPGFSAQCKNCSQIDPNSLSCKLNLNQSQPTSYYQTLFSSSLFPSNIMNIYQPLTCKQGYFINPNMNLCESCTLSNCSKCLNLTHCDLCQSPTIKSLSFKCFTCTLDDCVSCSANQICQKCVQGYQVINNTCKLLPCFKSCLCEGYYLPKINGLCSTQCGDGYKVGLEQCDDGNFQNNDGCDVNCKKQNCDVSCHCDGYMLPIINGTCTTKCGDGIRAGIEQCDDGNSNQQDYCSSECKSILPPKPILFNQQATQWIAFVIFMLFGFRIVGLEALFVLQTFQMILQVQQTSTMHISFFIHGLSNTEYFPIKQIEFFKHFNLMLLLIIVLFILGIVSQAFQLCKSSKITNITQNNQQMKTNEKQQSYNNNINDGYYCQQNPSFQVMKDFSDHKKQSYLTTVSQLKTNFPKSLNNLKMNTKKYIQKDNNTKNILKRITSVIIPQVLFDLIINCLSIVTFSTVNQFISTGLQSILNLPTLLTIGLYIFLVISLLVYCSNSKQSFGQNQLKFASQNKWIAYWMIAVIQRIAFSSIIAWRNQYYQYILMSFKLFFIVFIVIQNLFYEKFQILRNIAIQILHLLLIAVFTLNEEVIQVHLDVSRYLPRLLFEYIQLIILSIIVFISLLFFCRQFLHNCSTDFRPQSQTDNQQQQIEHTIKVGTLTGMDSEIGLCRHTMNDKHKAVKSDRFNKLYTQRMRVNEKKEEINVTNNDTNNNGKLIIQAKNFKLSLQKN